MELKIYQRQVLKDLSHYLELLNQTKNYQYAFQFFWKEKSAPSLGHYQDILPGVPNLCFKVPTGGGKTFLACNSIQPIFDALPMTKTKAVVWLVPSDAILTQTLRTLKNPHHPYRQKIDIDFSGRVEVYSKEELLNGQNFNPTAVTEQLSIMVLSYDSFRTSKKEGRKAYQENSNLAAFSKWMQDPSLLLSDTDETALIQVIRYLNPVIVVDESHHTTTKLSKEMLVNFNPSFVLDLTATPQKESNILCYVDAVQLKKENMVKLPVVVYNRNSKLDVLTDTIQLRETLEKFALEEHVKTGRYIRPIALFQAQPRGKEDSTTFEKLREDLIQAKIPAEQIAIRTSEINELKNVDLLSKDCPIRYIITINALKEGWDCPFAYILASLANKTSQIDVEQILGRILRLPYTEEHQQRFLNMSYVVTSSNHFHETVKKIIKGLNAAGFTDKDYRLASSEVPVAPKPEQLEIQEPESVQPVEEFLDFDPDALREELERRNNSGDSTVDTMLQAGAAAYDSHTQQMKQGADDPFMQNNSWEVRENMNSCFVKPEFRDDLQSIKLPQFFHTVPANLFMDGSEELLEKETLSSEFTLIGKDYTIDFGAADDDITTVDVQENEGGIPKVFKMKSSEQQYFKQHFHSLPPESRIRQCKELMFHQLNKMDLLDAGELKKYLELIVNTMDKDQLDAMEQSPFAFAAKIKAKIDMLLAEHNRKAFLSGLETGEIFCKPFYVLPQAIHPSTSSQNYSGSLYLAEDGNLTEPEEKLCMKLTGLDNIRWWHRNISQKGFRINAYINHYPDFIILTNSGKIVMAETKGPQLKNNDDSREKLEIGKAWQHAAGNQYRYYMVFESDDNLPVGAVSMNKFMEILKAL